MEPTGSKHLVCCNNGNAKIAIIMAFYVAPGSADGRRRVSERDGKMTDISLQKQQKQQSEPVGGRFRRGSPAILPAGRGAPRTGRRGRPRCCSMAKPWR
jgi:hypothetical protein